MPSIKALLVVSVLELLLWREALHILPVQEKFYAEEIRSVFTGITYRSDDGYVCHNYTLYTTKLLGGTLYTTKLLGGMLVSHISCRLCNAYSSGWIHFIFISSNFRRCVTCKVYCKVSKFEFLAIFLILYLWLCLVLTGDLMWITSIGNHGVEVGGGGGDLRTKAF